MKNLKNLYQEESEDIFRQLEQALLILENTPDDPSLIAEVFRFMHTLKGNSGMFGTSKIVDLVHNLETIYDKIRSQEILLNSKIVDFTFMAIDHMKNVIVDPELLNPTNAQNQGLLLDQLNQFLSQQTHANITATRQTQGKKTYFIRFAPHTEVLKNGTNPLLLLEELGQLGQVRIFPHFDSKIHDKKFDPRLNYASWNILLTTETTQNEIQDVFIFVEDDAHLVIAEIYTGDLLSNPAFTKQLPSVDLNAAPFEASFLATIIETLPAEPVTQALQPDAEIVLRSKEQHTERVKAISSIRVPAEKLDELMNQVSELVTTQAGLSLYTKNHFDPALEALTDNIEKLTRQLRDLAFGMTLVPIDNLFGRFQRVVRDLSAQLGKSVHFVTEGGETELDKTIIETLSDPLIHLIRNSLDHGIESPQERIEKGKPGQGTIKLKSYYSGAKVYIQVSDDGKGLATDKIRQKAVEKELIAPDESLTEKEIYDLIFSPGFSLAKEVTDISGRGVGMDVVRRNVLDIRGDITIDSEADKGTTFTLGLPLTLSVIDGLLIQVQSAHYILPLSEVNKCYEIKTDRLFNEFNNLIELDGEYIPFINLRREFEVNDTIPDHSSLVIIEHEGAKVGVSADTIVGEYQAVLKPIGKYYRNQEFVSGATILGDGSIALVLDAHKIIMQKRNKQKLVSE